MRQKRTSRALGPPPSQRREARRPRFRPRFPKAARRSLPPKYPGKRTSAMRSPPGDLFFLKRRVSRESERPPPLGKDARWRYFYALSAVGERESWFKISPVMPSSPAELDRRQSAGTARVWEHGSLALSAGSPFQLSLSQHTHAHTHASAQTQMRTCTHVQAHAHACAHTRNCTCMPVHTRATARTRMCTRTLAHMHEGKHTYTHGHTHTYTHMPAHTHMRRHIRKHTYTQLRGQLVISAVSWTFSTYSKILLGEREGAVCDTAL